MQAEQSTYPVTVELNAPLEVARWRPLVHWILAVPHILIACALQGLRGVLQFLSFFTILFTKQIPRGFFDLIVMTMRYQWRVSTYMMFMRESYPPFEFDPSSEDTGTDPGVYSAEYPEELSRFMPLVKWLLVLPHLIVVLFYGIGAVFAWLAAFLIVLFTGKFPAGIRDYLVSVSRYWNRVFAYFGLLRDEYPPFSLK